MLPGYWAIEIRYCLGLGTSVVLTRYGGCMTGWDPLLGVCRLSKLTTTMEQQVTRCRLCCDQRSNRRPGSYVGRGEVIIVSCEGDQTLSSAKGISICSIKYEDQEPGSVVLYQP